MAASETTRVNWEVTFFRIRTASPDSITAVIFANGRMQAPVDVFIGAVDENTHRPYRLTQAELNTIQLAEYNNPDNLLQGAWSYSDQDNGYAHSLLSSGDAVASSTIKSFIQNDDGPDHKRLYVTTTRVAEIRVGARIRQPNGRTVSLRFGGTFDSYIHLRGIPPVAYNRSSINVTGEVVVADGRYSFEVHPRADPRPTTIHRSYNQVNYYVSTNTYPLLKAYILGIPFTNLVGWENCHIEYTPSDLESGICKMHWIWETGEQQVREARINRTVLFGNGQFGRPRVIPIEVNQKENALCLTRMATPAQGDRFPRVTTVRPCGFELYDIYGNHGTFTASHSADFDEIVIINGRPSSLSTEQDQSQDDALNGARGAKL